MRRSRVIFLYVLATLFLREAAASNLTWKKTVLEIQAPPLAERIDAVFRFTNSGKSRVTLASVAASCGCTVPQIEKMTYGPGEKGELHALFTPDERVGLRQEEVMVLTDEPGQTPQVLVLRVTLPKLYEVTPYFVLWHGGEPPMAKKIKIHFLDPTLLKPVALKSHDDRVIASLEADPYSRQDYVVQLHAVSTATPLDTMVTLDLASLSGAKRVITLYAVVRAAPEPSPSPALH